MKDPAKDFTVTDGDVYLSRLEQTGFKTKYFLAHYRWLAVHRSDRTMIDFAEGDIFTYNYDTQDHFEKDFKEMCGWWDTYLKEMSA